MDREHHDDLWHTVWRQFLAHRFGVGALTVIALFFLAGLYAPFLASSQPLIVRFDGTWYFPLFRYLLFQGYYTKSLDIFFNIWMFTFPLYLYAFRWGSRARVRVWVLLGAAQGLLFLYLVWNPIADPTVDSKLAAAQFRSEQAGLSPSWSRDLTNMNAYAKLELVLRYHRQIVQQDRLTPYQQAYSALISQRQGSSSTAYELPTLLQAELSQEADKLARLEAQLQLLPTTSPEAADIQAEMQWIYNRRRWLAEENAKLDYLVMPLLRPYHWEDDAGGEQALNQYVPWWELTRPGRKDLAAALIFGVRICTVVGLTAVLLALVIGVPVGCLAGYYAGVTDIVLCRLMEIWEAMPTFFMLLLVVSMTQSKSIFLVIAIIGLFGWTGFSRYIRGEFFKQRGLAYVEACHAQGFSDTYIMFRHILPNALPPLITLLPFAVMGAISTEAGLSFLGLGEEGSCSWGVLMDEGRRAFPGESYLLWPPAILLTVLLVAIALAGDALRDALDPRLQRH